MSPVDEAFPSATGIQLAVAHRQPLDVEGRVQREHLAPPAACHEYGLRERGLRLRDTACRRRCPRQQRNGLSHDMPRVRCAVHWHPAHLVRRMLCDERVGAQQEHHSNKSARQCHAHNLVSYTTASLSSRTACDSPAVPSCWPCLTSRCPCWSHRWDSWRWAW